MNALLRLRFDVQMALYAIIDRPGRSVLTLLGIVIGILALTVMMALIGGLQSSVNDALLPLGAGVFQVQREPTGGRNRIDLALIAQRKKLTLADVEELNARLALTEEVGGEAWRWGASVRNDRYSMSPACSVAGMTPAFFAANAMSLEHGRPVTSRDLDRADNVAVIGSDVVQTLFPEGPQAALGAHIRVNNKSYTVIGTLEEKPVMFGAAWRNCVVAIPLTSYFRDFGTPSLHLTFLAKDRQDIRPAQEEARLALRTMHRLRSNQADDFEMFDNESEGAELQGFGLAITGAAGAICLIALMVGGVGVMNIMLVSVMERTREIGVRKALGARPSAILAQFMTEAIVLTSTGGAVGVSLAYAVVAAASAALTLPAVVPAWTVALALASSAGVGLVAGIYPAIRAARMPPIEALRYE